MKPIVPPYQNCPSPFGKTYKQGLRICLNCKYLKELSAEHGQYLCTLKEESISADFIYDQYHNEDEIADNCFESKYKGQLKDKPTDNVDPFLVGL